ncbi:nucleoside phosphorylase [Candidatus Woesearchaeota archaeon]|nr:nucleoside phosphorylase [Candidatus Woesearchaeota archaeon]
MAFPNLKNKHAEEAVFSPKQFLGYHKKIGRTLKLRPPRGAVFYFSRKDPNHYVKGYTYDKHDVSGANFYYIRETQGRVAFVGGFGIGAPAATTVLEEMIAWGVKRFILVGDAGGLQKHLNIGDLVVCDRAIRDEGTSHHYSKHSKYAYASKGITEQIKAELERQGQKYLVGTSWTIDAPYRETVKEAKQYQKEGVLTVEMEASAMFEVAKYRGAEIGAIFTVSDSLAELEWNPQFHSKKLLNSKPAKFKAAIDVLSRKD